MLDARIGSAPYDSPFSAEAIEQARIANSVRVSSYVQARLDLRGKPTFTFSGTPDKPGDCAYTIEEQHGGFLLGMHVIDADEFVCEGSPLDIAAVARFSSFREPSGKHVTMLPREILDGVCSFTPGTDRLAVSIFMSIGPDGALRSLTADRSIVRNSLCCVFSEVDALYSQSDRSVVLPLREKYGAAITSFDMFYALGGILYASRLASGCTDLMPSRTVFDYGSDGSLCGIRRVDDWDIGMVIREFMIYTGVSVGKLLRAKGIPCIYTCRDPLSEESLAYLSRISGFTPPAGADRETAERALAAFIKNSPHSELLCAEFSSRLEPVRYSAEPERNCLFGCNFYLRLAHPVHIYPDLFTLRTLKHCIDAGFDRANLNVGKMSRIIAESLPAFSNQQQVRQKRWQDLISTSEKQLLASDIVFDAAYIGGEKKQILLPWGLIADYRPSECEVCGEDFIIRNGVKEPLLALMHVSVLNPQIPLFCST